MSADVKQLRARIKSVDATAHLTGAMGLVASSKIRKVVSNMDKARAYANALTETVDTLAACPECRNSEFSKEREGITRLIVVGGDRGLAGGYNNSVFKLLRSFGEAKITAIGKRVYDKFGGYPSAEKFSVEDSVALAEELCREYKNGECGKVCVLYTEYKSILSQQPTIEQILPLKKGKKKSGSPIFEPDEETVLSEVIYAYVSGLVFAAVKESFASEIAARKVAMDAADKNAKKMIETLNLEYNRARQGSITQEITEIVAGSGT